MGERHERAAREWLTDWAGVAREDREEFDRETNEEFIASLGRLL
ncbi:MAG: hypothetical protein AB8I08_09355 [Sandaracinaceae bacterium]